MIDNNLLSYRLKDKMSDNDIVLLAQNGDKSAAEFLLIKYRNIVKHRIKTYYLVGAEKDDLIQIGMIGLWQAIMDYKPESEISFPSFAKVCIHRRVLTAIKAATRYKQMVLNNCILLGEAMSDNFDEWNCFNSWEQMNTQSPELHCISAEDTTELCRKLNEILSPFEWKVLQEYKSGRSYKEMSESMNCTTKSIDNALARIKRKIVELPIGHADISMALVNIEVDSNQKPDIKQCSKTTVEAITK